MIYRLMLFNTLTLLWAYAPIASEKRLTLRSVVVSCCILIGLRLPFYLIFNQSKPVWLFTVLRLLPTAVFLYFYKGLDWKRCLYFSSLTWIGFTLCSTIFATPWLSGITRGGISLTGNVFWDRVLGATLEHGTYFLVITVLTRLLPMNHIRKIEKERFLLLGYVIFCETYLVQMLDVTKTSALGRAQPELTVYIILMQSVVIGGMILFERYMAVSESRGKERMLDLAGQYRYEALRERQEAETDVRRLHHDMKNHLLALRSIENDPAKVDEYIEHMLDSLKKLEVLRRTGNELLDGLLAEKIRIAAVHGIEMTAELDFRPCSYMESFDVCTIFGNILDNAIEAAEKVQSPCQRKIQLCGSCAADQMVITCTNPYTGKLNQLGELYRSSKADAELHGIGLSNVKHSVEKYGGTMLIDSGTAGVFRLVLMLPEAHLYGQDGH